MTEILCEKVSSEKWLQNEEIPFTFEEIWEIREKCIENISG